MAAPRLKKRSDDLEFVITSVYGLINAAIGVFLWGEFTKVVKKFKGLPLLFSGDFSMMLEADDRPQRVGS